MRPTAANTAVASLLFLALFAAQAAVIALSPVLGAVASDFGVSAATAGQLRTLSGLAAAATALLVPRISRRLGLRALLLSGAASIAVASIASAGAPTFAVLAVAQLVVGAGVAALVAAGTTAAAVWVPEEHRAKVLSWTLIGQPAAWIVGMPLLGAVGEWSWRLGWLTFPLVAALAATILLLRREPDAPVPALDARLRSALGEPGIARWALAELLANCGWTGLLVYAGVLFTDSYGVSPGVAGVALAVGAVAYVLGNTTARRLSDRESRRWLVTAALLLAVAVPLFGVVRSGVWMSALLFAAAAYVAGARTLIAYVVGLDVAPERRLALMAIRASTTQVGYFIGSGAAGLALAGGGYPRLGTVLGLFFLAAAVTLSGVGLRSRPWATVRPCLGCA